MIYNLYSIFDRVSGNYGQLFLQVNDAAAVRQFNNMMQQSPMIASDCQLFAFGTFDSASGQIVLTDTPNFICNYEVIPDV